MSEKTPPDATFPEGQSETAEKPRTEDVAPATSDIQDSAARMTGEPEHVSETQNPSADSAIPEKAMEPGADTVVKPGDMKKQPADSSRSSSAEGEEIQPIPADTFWSRRFEHCSRMPPVGLLVLLALMSWANFFHPGQALYCPAEATYLSAFIHGVQQHSWLGPLSVDGGAFSVAQWPLYYWLLAGLAAIPGVVEDSFLIPLAGFISAALAVLGVWALTHAARFGARAAFAAGVITLCAPLFVPMPHFAGPTALSAAMMLFALACFCRGWMHRHAWLSLPLGFIFTALAGLGGGPLFFITPLVASFFFLIWRGTIRRAQAADALFGFILLLVILGAWLVMLNMSSTNDLYSSQLWADAFHKPWPLSARWWLVFAIAALGLLPWILQIAGVSWLRVCMSIPSSLSASRHENGSALLWSSLVVAAALALCTTRAPVAALALVCLTTPLLGRAFVHLPKLGNRFLFLLAGLFAILLGVHAILLSFPATQGLLLKVCPVTPPQELLDILSSLRGATVMGVILVLGGLYIFSFVRRYQGGGGLVFCALLTVLLCQPALLMVVPELGKKPEARLVTLAGIERMVNAAQGAPQGEPEAPTPEGAPALSTLPGQSVLPEAPLGQVPDIYGSQPAAQPTPEAAPVAPAEPAPAMPAPEATSPTPAPQGSTPAGDARQEEAPQAAPAPDTPAQSASPAEQAPPAAPGPAQSQSAPEQAQPQSGADGGSAVSADKPKAPAPAEEIIVEEIIEPAPEAPAAPGPEDEKMPSSS